MRLIAVMMYRVISTIPGTTGRVNKPITAVIVKLGSNIANGVDKISSPLSSA